MDRIYVTQRRSPRPDGCRSRLRFVAGSAAAFLLFALGLAGERTSAAEKLNVVNSSLVMSQSLPSIAQEAGLYRKYNLELQVIYIASSGMVTAAMLGGGAAGAPPRGGGVRR